MKRSRRSSPKTGSPAAILDTIYAFRPARVLLTAFEMDVFSAIAGGAGTSVEIAELIHANVRATDRLLNALCAMGFLRKRGTSFRNTPLTARSLVRGKPGYLAGIGHSLGLWDTWSTLTEAVRAGTSVARRRPTNDRGPDWLEYFIAAMHMRARQQAPVIAGLIDLRGVTRMLDVGGGSGAFAMSFARRKKQLTSTVFDLPNVVPLTQQYVAQEGLTDRVTTMAGDYTADTLGKGYDLVFLSAIIHSNGTAANRQLIRKAADALNPGGRVVILDHVMNKDRTEPLAGALFALNMLVGTAEGDTYTLDEVRGWMHEAGLARVGITPTPFGATLVVGSKKV